MDRHSAAEVARQLGTNVPRVMRGADRLRIAPERVGRGRAARVSFTQRQVARLRADLGVQCTDSSLSRIQAQVLAALARAPRGMISARGVARRARVSATAAAAALSQLEQRGLVGRSMRRVALGSVRDVEVLHANRQSPEWESVASSLAHVRAPERKVQRSRRVPNELRHLFWNTAESQLEIEHAGDYIARRLIQTESLDGLAWGAENLRPEHWLHAAATRGLSPPQRALARNLAGQSGK